MSKPNRATQAKRTRERDRQEKQQIKQEQRAVRKEMKKSRADSLESGVDPDLMHIVPGPQPRDEE